MQETLLRIKVELISGELVHGGIWDLLAVGWAGHFSYRLPPMCPIRDKND
jgi:hypothetical protein